MNRKVKIAFIILGILLLLSMVGNVVIYQRAQRYYLLLNESHLDPVGLNAFDGAPANLEQPVVVFFGDSRAADWPAPDQLKSETFVNRGIGNQTTAQMVARFQAHVAPLQPQIIVIQAGINDLKTIPLFPNQKESIIRNCKANLQQIVDLSVATGARVVVTTIFPLGKLPLERSPFWSDDVAVAIADVNSFIESLASDQVTIFHSEDVLANSEGIVDPQYSKDFLHLNPAGYAALNEAISELLVP